LEGALMSASTVNSVQPMVIPANLSQARTYSVAPSPASIPGEKSYPSATPIDSFLEAENPLGCIRGVMWVMAFNVAVLLFGLLMWRCVKFLM
jgi:hypothetical protein